MVPQFEQGFKHPQARLGTGKPQRLHVGGEAGRRGGGEAERTLLPLSIAISKGEYFPASPLTRLLASPKRIRSGQERIGHPLDADGGLGPMAAAYYRGIR